MRASEVNAPSAVERADVGDVDRDARGAQGVEVDRPVLLLVGDDEVRPECDDRGDVGVLRAAHPCDVEVGGMGAPVGGAHEQCSVAARHRFRERRHDAHDSSNPIGGRDGPPLVVDDHGERVGAAGGGKRVGSAAQRIMYTNCPIIPWTIRHGMR